MSKPNNKRLKLATLRQQREDALGGRYVELELDDKGTVVKILRQGFWPSEMYKAVRSDDVETNEDMLQIVCTEADWAAIEAAELELGDYEDIANEVTKGAPEPGESKGSSTS